MGLLRTLSKVALGLVALVAPAAHAQTMPDVQRVTFQGISFDVFGGVQAAQNANSWVQRLAAYDVLINVSAVDHEVRPTAGARVRRVLVCGEVATRYTLTTAAVPAFNPTDEDLRTSFDWHLGNPWNGATLPRPAQPAYVYERLVLNHHGRGYMLEWRAPRARSAALRAREAAFFRTVSCEAGVRGVADAPAGG